MDMNVTLNTLPQNFTNTRNYNINQPLNANPDIDNMQNNSSIKPAIPEKVMMDLKDVQNFLYMLIGSEIRVESDKNSVGSTINKTA